ncbi:hypothetical protein HKBW3S42_01117 [Candidatus Hakubella thermalkaliphila]|uniref:Uncharacterized protein n=1 Tax=Candidatus Hakubella thermalkaliphila TaxID=2754717 RepID=A0A6V8PJK9_9ACTN|nr:hypothetical protein HKBW3S42_01117 [Candidatus Hakubella thermalkaliphila]GFP42860.1 hypothetical protein HKBW3C_01984 [Candidatus Hakubella thermalkaliphila]
MIDKGLLDILTCPMCKAGPKLKEDHLICLDSIAGKCGQKMATQVCCLLAYASFPCWQRASSAIGESRIESGCSPGLLDNAGCIWDT